MKNDSLKTEQQNILSYNERFEIVNWGVLNDYPQQILRLIQNSTTGQECCGLYANFINGRGFKDELIKNLVVNRRNETLDTILEKVSQDYATFGGFALHLNYNALLQICEIHHIPYEHTRLGKMDKNGNIHDVALHWDWGKEYKRLRSFNEKDINRIHFYNPSREILSTEIAEVGDITQYKGQVLLFSNTGEKNYPMPIYTSAMKDMNTEDGVAVLNNRNVNNRFMLSGILVQILNDNGNTAEYEQKKKEFNDSLIKAQGAQNAGKILGINVNSKEDIPTFINLQSPNYADDYDITSKNVRHAIRQGFKIPPLLCSENVSTGFDTDAMQSAFTYYNSITERERNSLTRVFSELFRHWKDVINSSFEIESKKWDV